MDEKLNELKLEYKNTPIPNNLDSIVTKAIKRSKKRNFPYKTVSGLTAAAIFVLSINVSPSFAQTLEKVPGLKSVVKVLTFTEYTVNESTFNAKIDVPSVSNLKNKKLENSLNEKYLNEGKQLYNDFNKDMKDMKKNNVDGHLGVESGYEVKTDNDQILSIGRYNVNTVGSSSTTMKYDTIDKKKEVELTLPSLFKDNSYINIISDNIIQQMKEQMKKDKDKTYWIKGPDSFDPFEKIKANQSFYINKDHKLVISFDKYEVAPGYMGVVEFVIPTDVISKDLVGNEYIK
ncbi:DUF3298 domain-containing protein [Bacillus sp. RG28]|uniref:DUF3298 domain-containing protein n=1 Tax=Gottfriedia endophytica TaxID=2820819 RepID=A0A940NWA0_9BACI|nr:DUF3298 domain-containing protein [Gottfriedia endophytica]